MSLRLRPAGREAYLPAPAALQTYPQVLRLYDAIERWLEGQAGSVLRRQSLRNPPGTGGARFDVAYPIAP